MGVRHAALAVVGLAAAFAVGATACGVGGDAPNAAGLPPSFSLVSRGPAGGTMWAGIVPHRDVPDALRQSVVYLPPRVSRTRRLPVVYLLHGFRGSPFGYVNGLRFATIADDAIRRGLVRPFIAVMPAAGPTVRYNGEWAGRWETLIVRDVVPWIDRTLPTLADRSDRAIGGDSAGGYGGVDIGLRHPRLFGTLESWSGYFTPIADGPLEHAAPATLRAHSPEALAEAKQRQIRQLGMRIYASAGTHDREALRATRRFGRELARLRIAHRIVIRRGGHDGRFWRRQLPEALAYALNPPPA